MPSCHHGFREETQLPDQQLSPSRYINQEIVEALRKSQDRVGELAPVLVCLQHPTFILGGHHRACGRAWWPAKCPKDRESRCRILREKVSAFPTRQLHELLILQFNLQRPQSEQESRERVLKIAKMLEATLPKNKILATLAGLIYSRSYLSRLLPDEYKQKDHARSKGRPRSRPATSGTQVDYPGNQNEGVTPPTTTVAGTTSRGVPSSPPHSYSSEVTTGSARQVVSGTESETRSADENRQHSALIMTRCAACGKDVPARSSVSVCTDCLVTRRSTETHKNTSERKRSHQEPQTNAQYVEKDPPRAEKKGT